MPHPFFTVTRWHELQHMDEEVIALTKGHGIARWAPHIGDVRRAAQDLAPRLSPTARAKFCSAALYTTLAHCVHALAQTPYALDPFFRVGVHHLYNFPTGRYCRKQWNLGFWADPVGNDHRVRIGVGFALKPSTDVYHDAIVEYCEFKERVRKDPRGFNAVFGRLGNYVEGGLEEQLPHSASLADAVIHDAIEDLDVWRFFGASLSYQQQPQLIDDVDAFIQEVVRICDCLAGTPFGGV